MVRETGYFRDGKVIWVTHDKLQDIRYERLRNPIAPTIMQDTIDPIKHQGDGRIYESRSAFDRTSKALGLVPDWQAPESYDIDGTNIGLSDADLERLDKDIDQAQRKALNDLKWGNANLTDEQQLVAKETNEVLEAAGIKTAIK